MENEESMEEKKKKKKKQSEVKPVIDNDEKSSKLNKPVVNDNDSQKAKKSALDNNKSQRPKKPILNWKCIDNFDKVSDDKIFYNYKDVRLSEWQRRTAKIEFDKIKAKYGPILKKFVEEANGKRKDRLIIAGGNYTFFYVLPYALPWIQKKFAGIGVEIKLFEISGGIQLKYQTADIILTSETEKFKYTPGEIETAGYVKLRYTIKDEMYLAASRQLVQEYGSKEEVLKKANILAKRIYSDQGFDRDISSKYTLTVPGRENEKPRVTVDQYLLEYRFMRDGVGIGHIYDTMGIKDDDKIVILQDEPIGRFERFVIVKKDLDKKYHCIARRLIDILRYKEVRGML